jgi:PHP family Zn ribbon phosphoesterase
VATEEQIQIVLTSLAEIQACTQCGTRFRFGDLDCPHCGSDLDEYLRQWAEELLDRLGINGSHKF